MAFKALRAWGRVNPIAIIIPTDSSFTGVEPAVLLAGMLSGALKSEKVSHLVVWCVQPLSCSISRSHSEIELALDELLWQLKFGALNQIKPFANRRRVTVLKQETFECRGPHNAGIKLAGNFAGSLLWKTSCQASLERENMALRKTNSISRNIGH